MKRNTGKIGPVFTASQTTATGVFDTFDAYNYKKINKWPATLSITGLTPNSGTILENTAQSIGVSGDGWLTDTTLYWTILNGTSTSNDFYGGVISGFFTMNFSGGSFIITTNFIADVSKQTKTFQIQIRQGGTAGTVLYTSGTYSIPAISTPSVYWSTNPANENATTYLSVNIGGANLARSWTANLAWSGTASSSDFVSRPSTMNIGGGLYQIALTTADDFTTEGTESAIATVTFNSLTLGSSTLTINDTSLAITATVNASANSINEGGGSVTFTVNTTNFPSGTLYWTLVTSGNVTDADFSSPTYAVTSGGTISISGSSGTVVFTANADNFTESTSESFQLQVRSGSFVGTILATSSQVIINDNSQGSGGYTLTAGTKAPTLGATGHGTYPPTGWTGLQNVSADDSNKVVTIPSFIINNSTYTTAYVGSNTYITFGAGSTNYSGLGAGNPALNKIHLGAADNSYQRVSTISSGTDYTRIRYEGNGSTSGTVGAPGIVYEATFFNTSKTDGLPTVEVLFGNHNRTTGQAGIASTSSYYATYSQAANQSYVFVGNSTGTSWTIYTGYYMAGTGY